MKLHEVLFRYPDAEYYIRQKWIDDGALMRLMASTLTVEMLHLTDESKDADDWLWINE